MNDSGRLRFILLPDEREADRLRDEAWHRWHSMPDAPPLPAREPRPRRWFAPIRRLLERRVALPRPLVSVLTDGQGDVRPAATRHS